VFVDEFQYAYTEDAMQITATEKTYRSVPQAVRRLPPTKGNKAVHSSTMMRWITKGVRSRDGRLVKLAARRYPGGWKVSDEDIDIFIDELTRAALGETGPAGAPNVQTSARRQQELAAVDRELDQAGFGPDSKQPAGPKPPSSPRPARSRPTEAAGQ
jgi:hypothetical protein